MNTDAGTSGIAAVTHRATREPRPTTRATASEAYSAAPPTAPQWEARHGTHPSWARSSATTAAHAAAARRDSREAIGGRLPQRATRGYVRRMWLWWIAACGVPEVVEAVVAPPPEPPPPVWPDSRSPLFTLAPKLPRGRHRVVLDPGHGAPGNDGNTGALCQKEADEMLAVAHRVAGALAHRGALEIRSTRPRDAVTDYSTRIRSADAWGEVLISFHSDARSGIDWGPDPETGCNSSSGAHGFTVLWSDEGGERLVADRRSLARIVAAKLREAGFGPYTAGYGDLYEGDVDHPGTYLDRHEPSQRIRMLRRPKIPSIIVETHNAPDRAEVARWRDPATVDVFASALRAALVEWFAAR